MLLDQIMTITGNRGNMVSHSIRPWASATFAGERHGYTLAFNGDDMVGGDDLIAGLSYHEFNFPHFLVADASVTEVTHLADKQIMIVDVDILLLQEG